MWRAGSERVAMDNGMRPKFNADKKQSENSHCDLDPLRTKLFPGDFAASPLRLRPCAQMPNPGNHQQIDNCATHGNNEHWYADGVAMKCENRGSKATRGESGKAYAQANAVNGQDRRAQALEKRHDYACAGQEGHSFCTFQWASGLRFRAQTE